MNKTFLIIGGGLALLYWYNSKRNAADKLRFAIRDIQPNFTNGYPSVNVNIMATNPTNETISVNSVQGQLKMNGLIVGDVVSNLMEQIPAMQNVVIPVQVKIYTAGLFDAVKGFIKNINAPQTNFDFNGTVNFSGINFPVNLQYNLI